MKEVNKKYLIIGIVTTLILCLGVSVAYFSVVIRGEGKDISVTSKKLEVIFTDTEVITASNIEPGWSKSKTFSVENKTGKESIYDINIENLINTFELEYLEYKITSTNGYNMTEYKEVPKSATSTTKSIVEKISIPDKTTQTYTIEFRYRNEEEIDQSDDMGKKFNGKLSITEYELPAIIKRILADNPTVLTRTNFDEVLGNETATNDTIYKANGNYTEDGSEVYYFAGNVSNNWVKFGKDENNNDLYWRIIRTNEDGGVRLLYAGTSPDTTSGYISVDGKTTFTYSLNGDTYNDTMYVGWKYGTSGSLENNRTNQTNQGAAKIAVDTWYERGLNTKTDTSGNTFDKYISKTAIYCNDRSGEGYANSGTMYYGAYVRFANSYVSYPYSPSYRCGYNSGGGYFTPGVTSSKETVVKEISGMYSDASIADKFTAESVEKENKIGNGLLEYPVGLITGDEVAMAGGKYGTNNPYAYYYLNSVNTSVAGIYNWWTMSPDKYIYNYASVMELYGSSSSNMPGHLQYRNVSYARALRPVVSLKSCTQVTKGNGAWNTPYEVSVDSTCATAEN